MSEHDARRDEMNREFDRLYRRHRIDVYRAAMRRTHDHYEAEDVTQTAFLDAYRAVLRGTEPELPRAWLLAIAENVRKRRFIASLRRPGPVAVENDAPAPSQRGAEVDEIFSALAGLPPNQRAAFVLREVGGLTYPEIANRLDVSVPSVQMLLFRARQGLRSQLAPPDRPLSWLFAPHWLAGLASRFETASLGARSAGAVGAAIVVAAGVSGASAESEPRFLVSPAQAQVPVPVPVPVLSLASMPGPAAVNAVVPISASGPSQRKPPRLAPRRAVAAPSQESKPVLASSSEPAGASAPTAPPDPVVVAAAPAAPSTVGSTTVSGDGERPATALVPVPPSLGTSELPVPVAADPVPVPVVEPPSVEAPDLPALEPPVVPELPVEVGVTPPIPPGP